MGPASAAHIVLTGAALATLAVVLPVSLPGGSATGTSPERCLTMADAPPAPRPGLAADLQACSDLYPDDVELMADLGAAYEAEGGRDRAEAAYRRALRLDDGYADVRLRLARLLLDRGAAADARREIDAALAAQPNRADLIAVRAEADRRLDATR